MLYGRKFHVTRLNFDKKEDDSGNDYDAVEGESVDRPEKAPKKKRRLSKKKLRSRKRKKLQKKKQKQAEKYQAAKHSVLDSFFLRYVTDAPESRGLSTATVLHKLQAEVNIL